MNQIPATRSDASESEPLLKQSVCVKNTTEDEEKAAEAEKSCLLNYWTSCVFFIQQGPKSIKVDKKKWELWHSWDIKCNVIQIFSRDRDTELNVLDGIRALAYLW